MESGAGQERLCKRILNPQTRLVKPGSENFGEMVMTQRPFPSYWMYKDKKSEWRWSYEASNGLTIAVSSEGYKKRADCERSIAIMKGSFNSPTWIPTELVNAA